MLTFKGYEIGEEIGSGVYGNVYYATKDDKEYAIKSTPMSSPFSVFNEISLFNSLNHPYIMKPIDYGVFNGKIYTIMPLSPISLGSYIEVNPLLSFDHTKHIFWQILQAVVYMHDNHVIHRDLKPDNILSIEDHWSISDFGISKYIFNNTNMETLGKTIQDPFYTAPECVLDNPYDYKIDIWSLGCILYELLTKTKLIETKGDYYETRLSSTDEEYIEGRIELVYNPEARELLQLLLSQNPSERPSARELLRYKSFKKYKVVNGYPLSIVEYIPPSKHYIDTLESNELIKELIQDNNIPDSAINYGASLYESILVENPFVCTLMDENPILMLFLTVYATTEFDESVDYGSLSALKYLELLLMGNNFNMIMERY